MSDQVSGYGNKGHILTLYIRNLSHVFKSKTERKLMAEQPELSAGLSPVNCIGDHYQIPFYLFFLEHLVDFLDDIVILVGGNDDEGEITIIIWRRLREIFVIF